MKKFLAVALILVMAFAVVGCGGNTDSTGDAGSTDGEKNGLDFSRLRVLIGSTSTGGDTFQNADLIARYLEGELDINAKVDAVGAARAFDELSKAEKDGSTVMVFHDMAYLGVEYGAYEEAYALENWEVGPMISINPGNAFLTKHDAPYNTLSEAAEWLKENSDKTLTIAIQAGGTSQIGFDAFYNWVKTEYGTDVSDRIKAYVTGSQKDKDQALWDGNADVIHGSIPANFEYTKDGVEDQIKMKFLGITAAERVEGYDIPTFAEQGITFDGKPWSFDKDFFFLLPKDVDADFAAALDDAVAAIAAGGDYEADLKSQAFILNHKKAADAKTYLYEKRETMKKIIESSPDLDSITAN